MKKILAFLSVVLIAVSFTNEANAYTIGDGNGVVVEAEVTVMAVADVLTPMIVAVDNVTVASSVNNVAVASVNYMEVGGSIISSDSADPDQDNLVATRSNRIIRMMHYLSLRKQKKYLASNDNFNSVTNDKVGEIPSNVGKPYTSSWNTKNYTEYIS